ncbi:MAG: hypothetical protein HZA16_15750 [Nitrospirae bacterium]|nr:hypothetical protein [Nitrospirota bacterium]
MNNIRRMKYSIVFLLEKENRDFFQYVENVYRTFSARWDVEVLIIANGKGGFLRNLLKGDHFYPPNIKAFDMSRRAHQAVCLNSVIGECSGEFIVVCGSYQQITISSFEKLLLSVDDDDDIVSVWRQDRFDPVFYRMQSDLFNMLVRRITGTSMHDLSCNVRIFRRPVLEKIELYGNMYQYLPVFAVRKGFKSKEVKCEHFKDHGEPREARAGFYRMSSYVGRMIDIFTIYLNTSFTKKPLRLFSYIGLLFFLTGICIFGFIFFQKLFMDQLLGNRPSFILAIVSMIIGIQIVGTGLLGEIIIFTLGRKKREYVIEEII